MKIGLLHLSDIHFTEATNASLQNKASQIAGAIGAAEPDCSAYFILISGDVAYSGRKVEYENAIGFLSSLRASLQSRKKTPTVHIAIIPGNHDCDFAKHNDVRAMAVQMLQSKMASFSVSGDLASVCLSVQDDFFKFLSLVINKNLTGGDKLTWRHSFVVAEYKIEIICVNTSWLSQLPEKQGELQFPASILSQIGTTSSESPHLVVTMMHHPTNWFPADVGRELRSTIEPISDFVLVGHEHALGEFNKNDISGISTTYLEGGVLYDSAGALPSSFNCIFVDLKDGRQLSQAFTWSSGMYASRSPAGDWIELKRNQALTKRQFRNRETFKEHLDDMGTGFTHSRKRDLKLSDLYVYPDTNRSSFTRQNGVVASGSQRGETLLQEVLDNEIAFILGADLTGKTSLSKMLYLEAQRSDYIPLLLRGASFTSPSSPSIDQALKTAFSEQYGPELWESYSQLPEKRKVLFVDDFDECRLNIAAQGRVLEQLRLRFGTAVLFANDLFTLEDVLKDAEVEIPTVNVGVYRIREFGHYLRAQLIRKWVVLGRSHSLSVPEIDKEVVPLEKMVTNLLGRSLLPSLPVLVLTLVQAGEATKSQEAGAGSYGYLYEVLILKALAVLKLTQTHLDVVLTYLSRVAYKMLSADLAALTMAEMRATEDDYYAHFKMRLPPNAIDRLESAGVLSNSSDGIRFRYPYYYYFFAARYLRDNLGLESERNAIRATIDDMAGKIHYEDYAGILSFFVYLTKDIETIRRLLIFSKGIYGEYDPAELTCDLDFANKLYTSAPTLVLPATDPSKNRDDYRVEMDSGPEPVDQDGEIVEAGRGERKQFDGTFSDVIKVNVSTKMVRILGQILRNSPGSLPADIKRDVTGEAYRLGLRTLKALMAIPKDNLETMRTYLAELVKEHRAIRKMPELQPAELARMADQGIIWLSERYVFGIIRRVSQAIGVEELGDTYAEVLAEQPSSISFRLIDLSIKLDSPGTPPEGEIKKLDRDLEKNFIARNTLRELVFTYLYLTPVEYRARQRLTSMMEIKVADARLVDSTHKRR